MRIDPVRAALVAVLLSVLGGAAAVWYVRGRDPATEFRGAGTGGVAIAPGGGEEVPVPSRPSPVDVETRYADLFRKNFFAPAGEYRIEQAVVPTGTQPIDVGTYVLQGVIIIEGSPGRAFIKAAGVLASYAVGDSLPAAGEPVKIIDIRPDGVLLSKPGYLDTLLPLVGSIEEANVSRSWFGSGGGPLFVIQE